jgi:hypothetical protein
MTKKMARSGHTRCAMHIGKSAALRTRDRIKADALLIINPPRPVYRLAIILP